MKNNASSIALGFFFFFQLILFFFFKKNSSFHESKWAFVISEAVLVLITIWWYLASVSEKKKVVIQPEVQVRKEEPVQEVVFSKEKEALEKKMKALEEEVSTLQEKRLFSEGRLRELEQERELLLKIQEEKEGEIKKARHEASKYTDLIYALANESEKVFTHQEEERRRHAVEIRTLLKVSGKTDAQKPRSQSLKEEMTPLSNVLQFLLYCEKGLTNHENHIFPESDYKQLLRRAFFDKAKTLKETPFAIISLVNPMDRYFSKSFTVTHDDIEKALEIEKKRISLLKKFEPYYVKIREDATCVVFRALLENLDDLVLVLQDPLRR